MVIHTTIITSQKKKSEDKRYEKFIINPTQTQSNIANTLLSIEVLHHLILYKLYIIHVYSVKAYKRPLK